MYLKLHDWGVLNLLTVSASTEFEQSINNVNIFHSKWYFIILSLFIHVQCPYEFDFSISSPDDVIYCTFAYSTKKAKRRKIISFAFTTKTWWEYHISPLLYMTQRIQYAARLFSKLVHNKNIQNINFMKDCFRHWDLTADSS